MLFFQLLDDQLRLDAHIQWMAVSRTKPWKYMASVDPAQVLSITTGIWGGTSSLRNNFQPKLPQMRPTRNQWKLRDVSFVFKHFVKTEKNKGDQILSCTTPSQNPSFWTVGSCGNCCLKVTSSYWKSYRVSQLVQTIQLCLHPTHTGWQSSRGTMWPAMP